MVHRESKAAVIYSLPINTRISSSQVTFHQQKSRFSHLSHSLPKGQKLNSHRVSLTNLSRALFVSTVVQTLATEHQLKLATLSESLFP